MVNKPIQHSKVLMGLFAGALILIVGLVLVVIAKPDFARSVLNKIIEPSALASKEPETESKYLIKGASQDSTILVKFKGNVSEASITKIHQATKTKTKKIISGIKTRIVTIPTNQSTGQMIDKFKAMPEVEYVEPNFIASAFLTPNDSYYSTQWGLPKMSASAAWDSAKGSFGPIAVVDTGILTSHPDLSGEILSGFNFVNDTTNANDDNGHGTHVSGIIGALTNNGIGVSSIGYKSTLIPVKVLDSTGSGTYGDVASGIIFAADKGAKVINMSLGGASSSTTLQNAVNYANNKGVYIVAAEGNSASSTPLYPAACTGVLAVSATDSLDKLATFSSYGKNVFVGAPGVSINSTYLANSYRYLSGTSMSTPQFSGLLELALGYASSTGKTIAKTDMLNLVKSSSDKVGAFPYDESGWNQYFGYGRINAAKLITAISGKVPTPTPTTTRSAILSKTAIPSPTPSPALSQTPPTSDKFDVVIGGTIDYITADKITIKVKINNISQSIKLKTSTIIDLIVTKSTQIKRNGKTITVYGLKIGDKLNVKAQYGDNALSAVTITAQGK